MRKLLAITLLLLWCGCATVHTTFVQCNDAAAFDKCVHSQISGDITIVRIVKYDGGLYLVDYKQ